MKSSALEWTESDAPDDEPLPPVPPLPAPAKRRRWILWGLFIAIGLVVVGLSPAFTWYRLERDLRQTIQLEEQAALAGNTQEFQHFSDKEASGWLQSQQGLAVRGMAAPLPLLFLQAATEPGRVRSVESLPHYNARAEVARTFNSPGGAAVTYLLPQFYRYADGEWKRLPPPDAYWGEMKERAGRYTDLTYFEVDEEFAETLSTYLDEILAQACAEWACPAKFRLPVQLTDLYPYRNPALYDAPPAPFADDPLLFRVADSSFPYSLRRIDVVHASPHAAGYPADEASAALLRRAIALEALWETAEKLTVMPGGPDPARNAFLHALVARTAARLGLESAQMAEFRVTDAPVPAQGMWNWDWSGVDRALALRGALAALNYLLLDQPLETELRLFRAFRTSSDQEAWLAAGLSISVEEARARLYTAIVETVHIEVTTSDRYEFALSCPAGPALFSRGDRQLTNFLSGHVPNTFVASWSPDGEHLIVYFSDPVMVNFADQTVTWLPSQTQSYYVYPQAWVSDTVLAKSLQPQTAEGVGYTREFSIGFLDSADPARQFPTIQDINEFVLSPDRTTAAVVKSLTDELFTGDILLIPTPAGTDTSVDQYVGQYVDQGVSPAWSPDGKSLAYFHRADDEVTAPFSLRIYDLDTGLTRDLFDSRDLGFSSQPVSGQIAWSPAGTHLTFQLIGDSPDKAISAIVRPDGSNLQVLAEQTSGSTRADFSADGQFLAVTQYGNVRPAVYLYAVATGERLGLDPFPQNFAWSPSGHQFAMLADNGLYLVAEPADPQARPVGLIAVDGCTRVLWNPMYASQ